MCYIFLLKRTRPKLVNFRQTLRATRTGPLFFLALGAAKHSAYTRYYLSRAQVLSVRAFGVDVQVVRHFTIEKYNVVILNIINLLVVLLPIYVPIYVLESITSTTTRRQSHNKIFVLPLSVLFAPFELTLSFYYIRRTLMIGQ